MCFFASIFFYYHYQAYFHYLIVLLHNIFYTFNIEQFILLHIGIGSIINCSGVYLIHISIYLLMILVFLEIILLLLKAPFLYIFFLNNSILVSFVEYNLQHYLSNYEIYQNKIHQFKHHFAKISKYCVILFSYLILKQIFQVLLQFLCHNNFLKLFHSFNNILSLFFVYDYK